MTKTNLVISAYDIHYPHVNKPTLRCLLDFTAQRKPSTFIFGGDQLDLACISHHNNSRPLYRTEAAYVRDVSGFDSNVLLPLEKSLPRSAEKVWILGNHEDWERQLAEERPELAELVNHARLLKLKERGWRVIELGHSHRIGKLSYTHGEWLTGIGNQACFMPAKKLVEVFAANVVAGHTHSPQSFARISPVNYQERWMAWISPVLCNLNPQYTRNRPKNWVNGFNVTEFHSDGCFNHFPMIVTKGRCAYGGSFYGAKA